MGFKGAVDAYGIAGLLLRGGWVPTLEELKRRGMVLTFT